MTTSLNRAVLHADETGWRINGVTFWLWAFATRQYCYYLIDRHRGELLTFLDHEGVSPYNNHAEQQMRTAVHTRKVSQQNRSLQGAKTHAIFLTLFRSAQLQALNPVEYVLQLA